ncbi:tRNA (adenosine(37)-N6)-threonylcarbamoyltransferase complex ATPase subunit type 1 TsaE [Microcystis aeruginosa]|uniref:tRNA (adenosine(37)-N6)-threonylcarbamoyltransferase complex ATPase subunit type 1 TsaE n=1 Tax=Microcystis aeruginosa TaxID=1126 RepID=UPI00232F1696|nr:tRNA (adenosine(37)-N6)-threonylcarbamoyltransferase complex ATPase subunit type 1 TsaE [Microcystis aeruginosa]MDB9418136.1 tRNA (adenosine(37)-N6)-threonylcarbamoyltransferase complex ATPase subunit type 1 TsaE [Microcystis aeruginosa CS-556/03]
MIIDLPDREATVNLGEKLGQTLASGSVILLKGDLGAGKTTLVQGIGLGLGIQEPIASPTFTLVNEYSEGRLPLYHLDLYRLQGQDIEALYLENYWQGIEVDLGIVAIEWSERLTFLPENYLEITLLDRGEQGRRALLNFVGEDEKNSDPAGIAIST